ncbi:hypothetical protein A1OW_21625 [Enterovibrio norvegicus]|uniref:phage tail terminator protein n=1 Tax=Enterovibrio norvegicus TaxID=188144 RepID=UPI0002FB1754|nr:phage tail terminator protein [Enterovibrio norvegicus]OEF59282.1 hypothetical protein A1OW_21625 [Enterovibrio norvegicus]
MEQNTQLRETVAAALESALPPGVVDHVFNDWLLLDADEDTPAILVYLDDGDINTEYMDGPELYDGALMVSIYVGRGREDKDLDVIGEAVKVALPIGVIFPGVATLSRTAFHYERSESGAYRALHLTHTYKRD